MASIEVPQPDEVMSSSQELMEWFFKVLTSAIDDGYITHIGKAPIKSVGEFDLEAPFDNDSQVFAIAFGDSDEEAGEIPIHVGPILYFDDYIG